MAFSTPDIVWKFYEFCHGAVHERATAMLVHHVVLHRELLAGERSLAQTQQNGA